MNKFNFIKLGAIIGALCLSSGAYALDPPAQVAAAVSGSEATLTWSAVDGATGYNVNRNGQHVETVFTTTYTDTGLPPLGEFVYTVVAFAGNESGGNDFSANSVEILATTGASEQAGAQQCEVDLFLPNDSVPTGVAIETSGGNGASGDAVLFWSRIESASRYLIHLGDDYIADVDENTTAVNITYNVGDEWTVSSNDGRGAHSPRSDAASVDGVAFIDDVLAESGTDGAPLSDDDLVALGGQLGLELLVGDVEVIDSDGDLVADARDVDPLNPCIPYTQASACQVLAQ